MVTLRPGKGLDVLVYCAYDWRIATWLATGRRPMTSPPITWESFDPAWLRGHEVLYFNLHGKESEPRWYGVERLPDGERWVEAFNVELVGAASDLGGAVIFAQNCYGAQSPVAAMFLEMGAAAFVGGVAGLYGRRRWLGESDLLGRWWLQCFGDGMSAGEALEAAKGRLGKRELSNEARLSLDRMEILGNADTRRV